MQHPLPGRVSAHYGELSAFRKKNGMQPHSGTDYPARRGTPFVAVGSGTIKLIQFSKVLGWVTVQTVWYDKKTWYVGYCHQDNKPDLKVGQKVKQGEVIGKVGNTGMSSGAHLHMTFSRKLKGVFSVTSDKVDGWKLIEASKPTQKKTAPKKLSVTCPKCGETYYGKPESN